MPGKAATLRQSAARSPRFCRRYRLSGCRYAQINSSNEIVMARSCGEYRHYTSLNNSCKTERNRKGYRDLKAQLYDRLNGSGSFCAVKRDVWTSVLHGLLIIFVFVFCSAMTLLSSWLHMNMLIQCHSISLTAHCNYGR